MYAGRQEKGYYYEYPQNHKIMNSLFGQMRSQYPIVTDNDHRNAICEVIQQITLAGLYRGGFFNNAAFYGDTCLRIFHKLERFSEDMDFSLLAPEDSFRL